MPRLDFTSHRLFLDVPALAAGISAPLSREQSNYLLNVLRLGEGAHCLVFNGCDGEWRARVTLPGRRQAALVMVEQTLPQGPRADLELAFAPLKHARLDYMVQKAVEMGATRLTPVITRRTQVSRINLERMKANAVEAAEQCGILALPEIAAELKLDHWLDGAGARQIIFCDEDAPLADAAAALTQGRDRTLPLSLVIGPEGGFDPAERARLLDMPHVLRLSLGPRILRADTAAVAALAVVQAIAGDWRS